MYQTPNRNASSSTQQVTPPSKRGKRVDYGQKASFTDHVFTGLLYLGFIAGACVIVILVLKVFQGDPSYPKNKEYEHQPTTRACPAMTASLQG